MTLQQFRQSWKLAKDNQVDLSTEEQGHLFGFGLPEFKPVACTIRQVARLIRWQGGMFNGGWDMNMVDEVRQYGRKKFLIIE